MSEEQHLMDEQDELYDAHEKELIKVFGKKRVDSCNFGSSAGDDWICSKMYPMHKRQQLQWMTTTRCEDGSYKHNIES